MTNFFESQGPDGVGILTEEEVTLVVLNFATGRGDKGFTEEEAYKVASWANEAKVTAILFEMVLNEDVRIDLNDKEEVVFWRNKEDEDAQDTP